MEKVKLLFGLIEINKTIYNILYTLLCICILLITNVTLMFSLCKIYDTPLIFDLNWYWLALGYVQTWFLSTILFSKKHYE